MWYLCLEAAVTAFTSKPPNPTFVVEKQDISLVWRYTLDGTLALAKFSNVTGVTMLIGKAISVGSVNVEFSFPERFRADVSNTQAQLTILAVQRSDQGKYEFDITPTGSGSLEHVVEVIVQSKYYCVIHHIRL